MPLVKKVRRRVPIKARPTCSTCGGPLNDCICKHLEKAEKGRLRFDDIPTNHHVSATSIAIIVAIIVIIGFAFYFGLR